MLSPEGLDALVGLLPVGNRRSPVMKDRRFLGRRAPIARDGECVSDALRAWVGLRTGAGGQGNTQPTEIVALVIVAVPAAVVLRQVNGQQRAAGMVDRLVGKKDRLARLIPPSRSQVGAPRRLVFPIDRVSHRAGHTATLALVVEDG